MGRDVGLFSVRGIEIRVHVTFPLILLWASLQFGLLRGLGYEGALFGIIVTLLLFVIVVLHELGHSFAAQHYGVSVKKIVLLPIGGVAQLARIPEEPIQEFVVAVAGPLVNLGIAAVMVIVKMLLDPIGGFNLSLASLFGARGLTLGTVFDYVFLSNLGLGLFNLIPAFPMDGGRVLRALLASRLNYLRATSIAVTIGQSLAWLMGLWGLLGGGFFLLLVAFFIYTSANQEGQLVKTRGILGELTVDQTYSRQARTIHPDAPLRNAVGLTLRTFQADFPVCDGERLVGLLTHGQLVEALERYGPDVPVGDVMRSGVTSVAPGEALYAVRQRLAESNLEALPVAQDGRFLGLITRQDIEEVYRVASRRPELIAALTSPRSDGGLLGDHNVPSNLSLGLEHSGTGG